MFSYQPNQSRAGEYIGQGILSEAQSQIAGENRKYDKMVQGAGLLGRIGKTVAGFAMGGPAGAAMASGGGGGEGGGGGGLLDTIIGSYAKKEQDKADSKIYGNLMKIVAPAFGKDGDSLLEQWNSLESDSDRASFGSTLLGSLGTISNMYMAKGRMGMQQQGQQLATDRMYTQEQLRREREIMKQPPATGNTFTGGSKLRGLFQ